MAELQRPVRRVLESPVDEASYHRMWRAVGTRRAAAWQRQANRSRRWLLAVPAIAMGLAVTALAIHEGTVPESGADAPRSEANRAGALLTESGAVPLDLSVDPGDQSRTLRLADGSRLHLTPGTTLQSLENDGRLFASKLLHGRVRFDVRPGGPRRWTVDCDLALVEVVGTAFVIDRSDEELRVAVQEGRVRVHDRVGDSDRVLGPGEVLTIEQPDASSTEVPPAAIDPAPGRRPQGRVWRQLAQQGDYDGAWSRLGSAGLTRESRHAAPADLLALADVARLSGHPEHAVAPLERLLADHSNDASAGLAALTLAVIHMDQLGEPADASDALERALELGLPRSLREDALGRLAIARGRAGDRPGAAAAAARYLEAFPDGTRREAVRRWAGEE